jgi:XTP/dITP diphosphohydrolase
MQQFVFATHNIHKLKEVQALMPSHITLLSLTDIGCYEEIKESALTLEGNARLKADYITKHYGYDCFADDTGLEVKVLNGAPGVYSARYAGDACNPEANMRKLLADLEYTNERSAQFRTVIVLNKEGSQYLFEGVCFGEILKEKQGQGGFGYDPIFKPSGHELSFAEMSQQAKGAISHRGEAIRRLVGFLK